MSGIQNTMPISKMLWSQGVSAKARVARSRLIKKISFLILVVVASALFCVWSRVRVVQTGYEVTRLQQDLETLVKKKNHLELEVERLKSPAHLQKMAEKVLGMHPPSGDEIVFVKPRS